MLLALLAVAAVQSATPDTVVITGVPLKSLQAEAARCAEGGCTMRDDVVAAVRYAEGLFRVGRYVDSRETLQRAITRNRGQAKTDPAAMSALYEATATVARHDGEQNIVLSATGDRLRLLRETGGRNSQQALAASLDMIDASAEYGNALQRIDVYGRYSKLAAQAREAGQPALATRVVFHQAIVAYALNKPREAQSLLDALIQDPGTSAGYRTAALATAARFARERGDAATADALVSKMASRQADAEPVLIFSPKLQPPTGTLNVSDVIYKTDTTSADEIYKFRWADIGFVVKADGSVDSVEVLRGDPNGESWTKPLIKVIAGRRYGPAGDPDDVRYKIERWTLTADYSTPMGTNIRRRLVNPHYEQLDVTTSARQMPAKAP